MDCITLLALIRGIYIGYRSAFFTELLRLTTYLVTLGVTIHYYRGLTEFLTLNTFLNVQAATVLAFAVLVVGVFIVAKVAMILLQKLLKVGDGGFFNRLLGAATGACRWIVILSVLFMLIDRSPFTPLQKDIHERSLVGPVVAKVMPEISDFLEHLWPQLGDSRKGL